MARTGATIPAATRRTPREGGWRRWKAIALTAFREFGQDRISAAAGGVTFFMLLALFPALSAVVSLYSLMADVHGAEGQIEGLAGLLPGGALKVLGGELRRLASTAHGALGFAFAISLAVSIWSANTGVKALMEGLNVAYETKERRGFVRLNLVSLAFTLSAIAAAAAGVAFVVAAPGVLAGLGLGGASVLGVLRWPFLFVVAVLLLSALYRFGPSRPGARWRWITPGGVTAALGWMIMSALFSWYVANFGHYDKTYGSLGAIVGFLTWIWLSLMVVMFGAELNAAAEAEFAAPHGF
ncbi:MAG: YihY/virulence factor BrkB family protein [Caulobacteraceae bacterium]